MGMGHGFIKLHLNLFTNLLYYKWELDHLIAYGTHFTVITWPEDTQLITTTLLVLRRS